jgi:hypothetical protein
MMSLARRSAPCGAVLAGLAFAASPLDAAAQDASALYGQCFTRNYDAAHLAAHPGQRVTAISAQFQEFEGDLLASIIYTLRFGTKFGFSGACYVKIDGGYSCDACVGDSCQSRGEKVKILWSGGDTVRLVNDSTGMLAENQQGGRDYLAAGGEHGEFLLRRSAPEDCRW